MQDAGQEAGRTYSTAGARDQTSRRSTCRAASLLHRINVTYVPIMTLRLPNAVFG
jgi:hypothetical protein